MVTVKTEVGTDIYTVRNKMEEAMCEASGLQYDKNNDKNAWQWENKYLYADYESISSRQRIYDLLKNAEKNKNLKKIQNHETPLAVGVKATKSPMLGHTRYLTRYAFDLTRIKHLSKEGNIKAIQNFHEYEFWNWFCHKKHVSDYLSNVESKTKSKIKK